MKTCITLVVVSALVALQSSYAQIPRTLSYQAVLTDNAGIPKPDGAYGVTFRLYAAPDGGGALWTETQTLQVRRGLFSAILGSVTPFGVDIAFAQPYWLSLQVAPDPEMTPRLPLTSTAYSLAPWTSLGSNVYYSGGSVGIGTSTPQQKLHIFDASNNGVAARIETQGPTNTIAGLYFKTSVQEWLTGTSTNSFGNIFYISNRTQPATNVEFCVTPSGNVGIGNSVPTNKLTVGGGVVADTKVEINAGGDQYAALRIKNNQRAFLWQVVPSADVPGGRLRLTEEVSGLEMISVTTTGLGLGTNNPSARLEVIGRTKTGSLEITAGSDLAEPFDTETEEAVEPGSVMVIDAMNPGKLKLSECAYDARVAGIVSGAGSIRPGITLQQDGVTQGHTIVAIAGRVYCKADAHGSPIVPGDLLTTSNVPGHAMKATERDRSHGAIIGKAMSSLKSGSGLVLVLVNLQ